MSIRHLVMQMYCILRTQTIFLFRGVAVLKTEITRQTEAAYRTERCKLKIIYRVSMDKNTTTLPDDETNQGLPRKAHATSPAVRRLTPYELSELRRDMMASSAWAKAELARRRKNKGERS